MIFVVGLLVSLTFGWFAFVMYMASRLNREAQVKTEYFIRTLIPQLRELGLVYIANTIQALRVPQLWLGWVEDGADFIKTVRFLTLVQVLLCVTIATYQLSPYVLLFFLIPNVVILGYSLIVVAYHTFLIDLYGETINKLVDNLKWHKSNPDVSADELEAVLGKVKVLITEISDPVYWDYMKSKGFKTYVVSEGNDDTK